MNREQSHSERGPEMCREWSMSKGYSSATKDLGREDKHAHTNSASSDARAHKTQFTRRSHIDPPCHLIYLRPSLR